MAEDITVAGDDVWHPISRSMNYCIIIRHHGNDGEQHAIMSALDPKVPIVYKGNILPRRTTDDVLGLVMVRKQRLYLWAMETNSHGYNSWMLLKIILLYSS